jgi:cell wall-associated NlpC family hydrolase
LKADRQKSSRFLPIVSVYLAIIFMVSVFVSYRQHAKRTDNVSEVCVYARSFLSDPELIKLGEKFDCSEFTRNVYKKFGYSLPRSAEQQFNKFFVIDNIPKPGDLLFFSSDDRRIGHVAIYLKNNTFIHSAGEKKGIKIDKLTDKYWKKRYKGSGSVIKIKN